MALIGVVIISAVILVLALSGGLLSISESDMSFQKEQSSVSLYLATACAEHALMELRDSFVYTGNETIAIDGKNCYIRPVINISGQERIVEVWTDTGNQYRKMRLQVFKEPGQKISIGYWREIADF